MPRYSGKYRLRPRFGVERDQYPEDLGNYEQRQNSRRQQNELGEKYGDNYGYAREGDVISPMGYSEVNDQESQYVYRYDPPLYSPMMLAGARHRRPPRQVHRSDEDIYEQVCERLKWHGHVDASQIKVQVENQEVTLQGSVNDRRMKKLAGQIADSVPGVEDVHNQLHLQNKNTFGYPYEQGSDIE